MAPSAPSNLTPRLTRLALATAGASLIVFILRTFPPGQYRFYPVCPIHAFTGLLCPGCGATRALAALLHGHVAEAFHQNALILCLLPFALAYGVGALLRTDRRWPQLPPALFAVLTLATVVFTVVRNLP